MTRNFIHIAILAVILSLTDRCRGTEQSAMRTWADSTGKFRVEATLLDFRDGQVHLKKKGGQTVTLPIDRLSEADQSYVHQTAGEKRESEDFSFTNRRTGEMLTGRVLKRETVDGRRRSLVETGDGERRWLWAHEWAITPAEAAEPGVSTEERTRDDLHMPQPASDSQRVRTYQVEVVGVGLDRDAALQNAYSRAIEQAVGVMVEAETKIANDEIIKDEILTYSRGYVAKYEETERKQADAMHEVAIRAWVATEKLAAGLEKAGIAVARIPGEHIVLQLRHEIESERNAAAMFHRAVADCTIASLAKVEIVGTPEVVEKNAVTAKLLVRVKLSSDLEKWKKLGPRLNSLLHNISSQHSSFVLVSGSPKRGYDFKIREADDQRLGRLFQHADCVVCLLTGINGPGTSTAWKAFQVPKSIAAEMVQLRARKYRLCIVFLDDQGQPVLTHERVLETNPGRAYSAPLTVTPKELNDWAGHGGRARKASLDFALSPLIFTRLPSLWHARHYQGNYAFEERIVIDLDKFRQVRKCEAYIEEIERD